MGKIKWTGRLNFSSVGIARSLKSGETLVSIITENIPVKSFSVTGGAVRTVHLKSGDDGNVTVELNQALKFKNIVLNLSPGDGLVRNEITTIANNNLPTSITFSVLGSSGKTTTHIFHLTCEKATLKVTNGTGDLQVKFQIPDAKVVHGFHSDVPTMLGGYQFEEL